MLKALIAAALLASGAAAFAQSEAPKARGLDCSKAKDPKACEERVAKAKAAREKAKNERVAERAKIREACKDRKGAELRNCIREQRSKK